jgi:trk system potassium uptake protein TrkH
MMRRWDLSVDLRVAFHLIGIILKGNALTFLVPLIVALLYRESIIPFLVPAALSLLIGWAVEWATRGEREIGLRESFLVVAVVWVVAAAFGAMPFVLAGVLKPVDAYFEAMSGYTTTGASVITNVETQTHSLLIWRAFMQWLGGLGIVALFVAIFPNLAIGGRQIMEAEAAWLVRDKLTPRLRQAARSFWGIYIGLTLAEILLLWGVGLSLYEAVAHALTTLATGGFSTRNVGIADFSGLVAWIIIPFMILGATSFTLMYRALLGRTLRFFAADEEFKFFIGILVLATLVLFLNSLGLYESIEEALRHSAFQATSIMTTTGYASTDFDQWNSLGKFILLLLMFFGGSAGSTTGSIKVLRALVIFKLIAREIQRIIHPQRVIPVRLGGRVVPEEAIKSILILAVLYVTIFAFSTALLLLDTTRAGLQLTVADAASAVAATMGSVGPGFGIVGPMSTYADLPTTSKALLVFCMWIGRLEIFPVIVLFARSYWKG